MRLMVSLSPKGGKALCASWPLSLLRYTLVGTPSEVHPGRYTL